MYESSVVEVLGEKKPAWRVPGRVTGCAWAVGMLCCWLSAAQHALVPPL